MQCAIALVQNVLERERERGRENNNNKRNLTLAAFHCRVLMFFIAFSPFFFT